MLGDYLNNNKRREVRTREDQVMFYGKKYRTDKKTRVYGVYLWGQEEASCCYVGGRSGA